MTADPTVTIVIVPRERHSALVACIDSLYRHTPPERFRLIVVQGDLPEQVRAEVGAASERHGFDFVHRDHPLRPNEARNIGLGMTQSEWIVFADNDIDFTEGWLDRMVEAATEYGAWVATPLITHGLVELGQVHVAGPEHVVEETDTGLRHEILQRHQWTPLQEIQSTLERHLVNDVEFHVVLARTETFDRIGPLDEAIVAKDHSDFGRDVVNAGGKIVFEPSAVVGYDASETGGGKLDRSDIPYYVLRFSQLWNTSTFDRLEPKWQLRDNELRQRMEAWTRENRYFAYRRLFGDQLGKALSPKLGPPSDWLDRRLEHRITAPLTARRVAAGLPA